MKRGFAKRALNFYGEKEMKKIIFLIVIILALWYAYAGTTVKLPNNQGVPVPTFPIQVSPTIQASISPSPSTNFDSLCRKAYNYDTTTFWCDEANNLICEPKPGNGVFDPMQYTCSWKVTNIACTNNGPCGFGECSRIGVLGGNSFCLTHT